MSQERDLWMFAKLNLAIVYLRGRRDSDLAQLMEQVQFLTQQGLITVEYL